MSETNDNTPPAEAVSLPADIVAAPERRERVSAVIGQVQRPAAGPGGGTGFGGNRQGGGQQGRGRGGPRRGQPAPEPAEDAMFEKVVHINRCAKVVAGGRRFSFSALVVVGDQAGSVGIGYGKAKEVPDCIRKGTERAKKELQKVSLKNNTIPHEAIGTHDGGRILLKPAVPGTGLIAGGGVRAVLQAAGVKDVLTKSLGSNNPAAMVFATLDALKQMRSRETITQLRKA
jgi:small subunit ribosomal protein S5